MDANSTNPVDDVLDEFEFLCRTYLVPDEQLTEGAQELKRRLLEILAKYQSKVSDAA